MLGPSYFVWRENEEWYEIYDLNEETGECKVRLTEKAPPEAVDSFQKWEAIREKARQSGNFY